MGVFGSGSLLYTALLYSGFGITDDDISLCLVKLLADLKMLSYLSPN